QELERRLATLDVPLTVAVMGCAVNGPGEAREADVGLAGGRQMGLIFRHGQIVRRVDQARMVEALWEEIQDAAREKRARTPGPAADKEASDAIAARTGAQGDHA
ncbi:MAG: flavodoxin-dependent (E)-4-hydroxy-3-methylbut-2-enyl-diphosphate synthase, partial [Firmicutes bacterium]|nr:flavodoxin-dependent (E)-4-hydroxy-3-methylbut-2-enyl-diphosphate synthase [Bacillota bacterium]